MTLIVGIIEKKQKRIILGADRCASWGNGWKETLPQDTPKLYRKSNKMIIGCASSARQAQIIGYQFKLPAFPKNCTDMKYLTTSFVNSLRKALKEAGVLSVSNQVEKGQGVCIVAMRSGLYEIGWDFGVNKANKPYMAIGSGLEIAYGSLFHSEGSAKGRIAKAMEVATEYIPSVGGGYTIMELKW